MSWFEDDVDEVEELQNKVAALESLVGQLFARVRALEKETGTGDFAP